MARFISISSERDNQLELCWPYVMGAFIWGICMCLLHYDILIYDNSIL